MITIGVLALQGSFREHLTHLTKVPNIQYCPIKYPVQLDSIDGIILPGGESTSMIRLLHDADLFLPLQKKIQHGLPVWGTCAGLILLSKSVANSLNVMSTNVERNAYGSQLDSFTTTQLVTEVSDIPLDMIFIRAPLIRSTFGKAKPFIHSQGQIIGAMEDHMMVTSFHPELTNDSSFHNFFVTHVRYWSHQYKTHLESCQT